ncbi:hypothetical protein C8K18_101802 [Paraburkholderia sp. GV068]|uniref:hypothetical protein n=1 Tax=unclassified Paraburkholderia TaxID=2615204 RepID=UPI000D320D8A|nr:MULTISPECIES: hypothetical protein [unclassified Paraburkholderia]PTR04322.1 hypothetical protein C8K19_101727 [Paraburkholderia sp. GV072]PUB09279.1 hypothetical protein C8K18_101802 [Paraburkholderia sp. GV068]
MRTEVSSSSLLCKQVASAVTGNIEKFSAEQLSRAASFGVTLDTVTKVYVNDGTKTWATVLAELLCGDPSLAALSGPELAKVLTNRMNLDKPFSYVRLSKPLSVKQTERVHSILRSHGYSTANVRTGLGIRDSVAAGAVAVTERSHTVRTQFKADGVFLGDKFYPYVPVLAKSDEPWYRLGIRLAGDCLPLRHVLTIRGIGIQEFIRADSAAVREATPAELKARRACLR